MRVRNLGQYGIIKDTSAQDIPLNAWSSGNNVRFYNNRVMRSLAFRDIATPTPTKPYHMLSYKAADGASALVYPGHQGNLYKWLGGTETDVTPSGFTPTSSDSPFTSCVLSGVPYINRPTHVPYGKRSGDTLFQPLTGWHSTWRCKSLRAYKDFLIALNVTKGATEYPRLFKASHFALNDSFPASWDANDITKLTYETEVTQIDGPLVDGLALRNSFVIYGETQCALVNFRGGSLLYDIKPLFSGDAGLMNQNCVIEREGKHYVFGKNDIYMHDGVQKKSIVEGRNKDHIFKTLNFSKSHRCFVVDSVLSGEVFFCYPSYDDGTLGFTDTEGCNKAVVYNRVNDTWTFVDLPNVHGAAEVNVGTVLTWATASAAWDDTGAPWAISGSDKQTAVVMGSAQDTANGLTTSRLLGLDTIDDKSVLAYPLYSPAIKPAWVVREGIDMDEDPSAGDLAAYKLINRILPQVRTFGSNPVYFKTGGQLFPNSPTTWANEVSFDPNSQYKVDVRKGGRYLALSFRVPTANDFEFSGYDAASGSQSRR